MLEKGNYWVYQWYQVNLADSTETPLNKFDSIYVAEDTVINDDIYYIIQGSWFASPFRRTLSIKEGYLVDISGNIYLSPGKVNDTIDIQQSSGLLFVDSIYTVLTHDEELILTPSGSHISDHQYRKTFFMESVLPHSFLVRPEDEFYVKGIGVVKYSSFYASSPTNVELRLSRYNVQ